jgi:hypothetical protein
MDRRFNGGRRRAPSWYAGAIRVADAGDTDATSTILRTEYHNATVTKRI